MVDGLSVDPEMRWALLAALAAGGAAGDDEIDAELNRDDTATGRVQAAAAARAAIPTAAGQGAGLAAGGGRTVELPNTVQAAVISGFSRVFDPTLLEPFVERYFEALVPVWQERTNEMASQIVAGLYPTLLAGPALLEHTDRWLASTDAEPALRRLVVEARDGVVRALTRPGTRPQRRPGGLSGAAHGLCLQAEGLRGVYLHGGPAGEGLATRSPTGPAAARRWWSTGRDRAG